MSRPLSSGLVVPVEAAASLVAPWVERLPAAGRGLPPHVTALWPFLPVEALDEAVERRLEGLLAGVPAFSFALTRVAGWPTPPSSCPSRRRPSTRSRGCSGRSGRSARRSAAPTRTSRRTSWSRSTLRPAERAAIEAALAPHLPLACRAAEVLLLEETASGVLRERRRFSLAAPA